MTCAIQLYAIPFKDNLANAYKLAPLNVSFALSTLMHPIHCCHLSNNPQVLDELAFQKV
jgi:hypothetical protein